MPIGKVKALDAGLTPTEQRRKAQIMRQFLQRDGSQGNSEAYKEGWERIFGSKAKSVTIGPGEIASLVDGQWQKTRANNGSLSSFWTCSVCKEIHTFLVDKCSHARIDPDVAVTLDDEEP